MSGARIKVEDGIRYVDTGEDDMLDQLNALLEKELMEQKAKAKGDSVRSMRMAGISVKRDKK